MNIPMDIPMDISAFTAKLGEMLDLPWSQAYELAELLDEHVKTLIAEAAEEAKEKRGSA